MKRVIVLFGLIAIVAVGNHMHAAGIAPAHQSAPVAFPFAGQTMTPYVVGDGKDGFAVSWLDRSAKTFNVARYGHSGWSGSRVIAHGDLLENKADYGSIALSGTTMWAQWRERSGDGRRIRVARSGNNGITWSAALTPHPELPREFGFVSLLPLADGSMQFVWLDGRRVVHEGAGETELHSATLTPSGTLIKDAAVDTRVCDCCQTAMAMTSRGPLVVYRDRSAGEVRDIVVARPEASAHATAVHADNWHITGCPVNGPRIDARGDRVVVAWFTSANGRPAVNVAWSHDSGATFGEPIRIDGGHAAGRVDVALLSDGSAIATWVEATASAAHVVARRVTDSGPVSDTQILGDGASAAAIGFPRIAVSNDNVLAAWSGEHAVRLAMIKFSR